MTQLSGPITGGARGRPFSLPTDDVDAAAYVAEEFFLDGVATAYALAAGTDQGIDGEWSVEPNRTAPFRTRLLVVRPRDETRFNGTVAVHWQNVTAGFEIGRADARLLDEGYAWVGVSAQRAGLEGLPGTERSALKGWDPERYGALEHPGDDFSYDIFNQAAQAVAPNRPSGALDPLGGLTVARLLGVGASQSAMRLRSYINAIHPREHLFDGFMLLVDFGFGTPFDTTGVDVSRGVAGIPPTVSTRIRADLDVPVFVFNSETETPTMFVSRQPDSARYRLWEVAGTCHTGGLDGMAEMMTQLTRDDISFDFSGGAAPTGTTGSTSTIEDFTNLGTLSYAPANRAALRHMQTWLTDGTPPPAPPRVEVDVGPPTVIRRDDSGNALGGVRLPDFAVPVASHNGTRTGAVLLGLLGWSRPFTPEELAARYPDRDAYLKAYDQAVDDSLAAGVVLMEDAPSLRQRATATASALFAAP